jgi:hypothetical protein
LTSTCRRKASTFRRFFHAGVEVLAKRNTDQMLPLICVDGEVVASILEPIQVIPATTKAKLVLLPEAWLPFQFSEASIAL